MDEWELLWANQSSEALQTMRGLYEQDQQDPSTAIELGAFYFWLCDWHAAYEHFCHFTDIYHSTTDFAFKFTGTAKWCEGSRRSAVEEWKQGLNVDFSDVGGGITIPLHLFLAATTDSNLFSKEKAIELLRNKLQAKPQNNWPGYLARILLGELASEAAIAQSEEDVEHLRGHAKQQAVAAAKHGIDFWHGVRLLSTGDSAGFQDAMQRCSNLSRYDYSTDRDLLIDLLRSSEFHLARYESGAYNRPVLKN